MHMVGLCETSQLAVEEAEKDIPKSLCPMVKASYVDGVGEKCPFFYFSDLIVWETTCDGKKKMYELLEDKGYKTHIILLPKATNLMLN